MKKAPLEYVEWLDHASGSGWCNDEDLDNAVPVCIGAGFVLKETKKVLCLANFCHDGASHSRQYIIKSAIIRRKRLVIPR